MKGLALAREFWEEIGEKSFRLRCPEVTENAAVGLVGEGSECYGFDDEISCDHDWGPGFCVWLTKEQWDTFGEKAVRIYASLPPEFSGFRRLNATEETASRVGIHEIGAFFRRYTGFDRPPETIDEWRQIPENGLSVVTNGEIFFDRAGEFTRFREALSRYYPEQLRLKKLAAVCALAAQAGQYNYARCAKRGENVAAMQALSQFAENAMRAIFILNKKYKPYYKWTHHALASLPILGKETHPLFAALTENTPDRVRLIEKISELIIDEIRSEGLSQSGSDFLLDHAAEIQSRISDKKLSTLHLMAE